MNEIVKEYARALMDLAIEAESADALLYETRVIGRMFDENPAYTRILSDPKIPKAERVNMIGEAFCGGFQPYLTNFLKLVTERGYARHIPSMMEEYESLYCETYGIVTATATSAVPLTEEQKRRLTEKVSAITGKMVSLHCKVDPALIGGVSLSVQNTLFEGSVRAKLNELRASLKALTV